MLYWGKLNSTENDPTHRNIDNASGDILRATRVTDVSMREGLAAFLRDTDGKVIVVTSQKRIVLKKDQIKLLSSGKKHVITVTETGMVNEWNCSDQSNIPRTLGSLSSRHVVQVACGNYHSIALTEDGQLFTWGQNSRGQLGLGNKSPSFHPPQLLESLCGIPLTQISAGGYHSFALSLSGAVFGWGRNCAGQLGLGDRDDRHVPVCVKSLNLKKTVFISCGEYHTAVLTKGGLVLTFGSGRYGQLGHNSLRDEHQPRVVAEFWGSKVSQIACGQHHTLALVESSNTIYSFGCGEQGQLGNGQRSNQCVPLPVQLPPEYSSDQIRKINAGGNISVLFISKKDGVQASSNLRSCNGQAMLEDKIIGRWISDCNPKVWKKIQREIKKIFSSASFINGSFIDKSNDKHYETSVRMSGLDLSLARLAFEKLAKNDRVLSLVEKTVENHLLPSLGSTAAGAEALRVYLVLPELLRVLKKHGRGTQLTILLASAILKLEPESMDVLNSLWTTLPYNYYRTLVKMFHSVCSQFLSLMMNTKCNHWTKLEPVLKVLQKLYNINSQRTAQLTEGYFTIKDVCDLLDGLPLQMSWFDSDDDLLKIWKRIERLKNYPFVLNIRSKYAVFQLLQVQQSGHSWDFCFENTLCVNRETVLDDTLVYLKKNSHKFSFPLTVKFALEDGIDYGALRAEYFTLLGKKIAKDSCLIQASEDSGYFWFSADDSDSSQKELFYIGVICGMAFYNHNYMYIGFPVALFKKLLNIRPTFKDLEELSPVEARSLKNVLAEDEDVVELLDLDFTVKGKELIPNGAEIPVTKANRHKYVDLYVDFVFNKSVKNQFRAFKRGFSHGNPFQFWKIFKPVELRDLLYGTAKYEWKELQKGVTYELCEDSDELIQNFWSVFFELVEKHKKMFLTFIYGTDRLPLEGLSKLQLKIVRQNYDDADDRFPRAQTCYRILYLPNYSNIQILQEKLIHAITYCEVFGQA
ncbi:probable E3 ubiquitin-protein ligase HERC3 isoform X2 [Tachysurus fulvidraco]|uniref:probable E3 ubiquitin-protein ligase HERC3 isoform X2 n=1 Tax=Tachysurus fulvidraco TaxID=1234273 RepID=UPI001FEEB079|nr:probable E3 ubiquitin-protein ligase HERC3 isoform X2 [Tachysurus fulvidraco]